MFLPLKLTGIFKLYLQRCEHEWQIALVSHMSCPAEFEFVEVFFVLLATLLTCSLVAAAEFSTLSQRRAAAQRRSCCQTQTETKSRKWADSEKRPLAWKVAVSNCGPAGKILEIVEKTWTRITILCLKSTHLKFSWARQRRLPAEFMMRRACGVSGRPPGVNTRKHMNINEDADEKGGTVLSKTFLDKWGFGTRFKLTIQTWGEGVL